ncbi:FAD-dependent oxidoreductase [Paenibacillus senegalensis]|uniref:FAD-dependent oxidoreductase n=1 Tax=Paenibacillus senegalensis TaxID=1465766 RepID=UPI00028A2F17|nr:FAD-dependent oxidoreductase [Paenibacillus senegalensis]
MRSKHTLLIVLLAVFLGCGGGWLYFKAQQNAGPSAPESPPSSARQPQQLEQVEYLSEAKEQYDVIVVGTDPEGIAAALSASRNGLNTLLVDGYDREILGGLMTLGWLNTIDMNYDEEKKGSGGSRKPVLNEGIFSEWYAMVEGDSFDVTTAANAFYKLVKEEENLDLLLKAQSIEPIVSTDDQDGKAVEGVTLKLADGREQTVKASYVIDATQDGDIGYAAGVPFTVGREDLGDVESRMAVTLVFRLKNADDQFWKKVEKRLAADGDPNTGTTEMSAWGFGEMQKYPAVNKERVKMRGLNIGRQNDDTILINALQIFGVDPFDPKSKEEAFQIGKDELPNILKHMQDLYPEFADLELDATAPELYVRESRHMVGMYRLSIVDVLENKDHWDRIGFGSYPVDIQRTSPEDNGAVVLNPVKYAIPFRSIVPLEVDNLLVVGKAASYDTLPHGSARVIPTGMGTAESAGAAAKVAMEKNMTFRQLAESEEAIALLQERINNQGMDVQPYTPKTLAYMKHPAYPGLKAAVYMALTVGGYDNNFALDDISNPQRLVNQLNLSSKVFPDTFVTNPSSAVSGINNPAEQALTLEQACLTIVKALGLQMNISADEAQAELVERDLIAAEAFESIKNSKKLTNGDVFMLLYSILDKQGEIDF